MFVPNKDFLSELRSQDEHKEALKEQAEAAKAKAEPLVAPTRIMPSGPEALVVEEDEEGVYLVNSDHGGHLAEWGSANNPPYALLRRGVRAAGFRLDEQPKT